jgi:hypothetical protein
MSNSYRSLRPKLKWLIGLGLCFLTLLGVLLALESARADVTPSPAEVATDPVVSVCSGTVSGHKIEAHILNHMSLTQGYYSSSLSVDGTDVAALTDHCFVSNRPSTVYVKCTHQSGKMRYELYPRIEAGSATVSHIAMIIWTGEQAAPATLDNCSL